MSFNLGTFPQIDHQRFGAQAERTEKLIYSQGSEAPLKATSVYQPWQKWTIAVLSVTLAVAAVTAVAAAVILCAPGVLAAIGVGVTIAVGVKIGVLAGAGTLALACIGGLIKVCRQPGLPADADVGVDFQAKANAARATFHTEAARFTVDNQIDLSTLDDQAIRAYGEAFNSWTGINTEEFDDQEEHDIAFFAWMGYELVETSDGRRVITPLVAN